MEPRPNETRTSSPANRESSASIGSGPTSAAGYNGGSAAGRIRPPIDTSSWSNAAQSLSGAGTTSELSSQAASTWSASANGGLPPRAFVGAPGLPSDQPYSPGPSLLPIDNRRGPRYLGPVLGLIALAIVIIAGLLIFNPFGNGGDASDGNTAAPPPTKQSAQVIAPTSTSQAIGAAPTATASAPTPTSAEAATADTTSQASDGAGNASGNQSGNGDAAPTATKSVSARSFLPSRGELPSGFEQISDDKRTIDEVADAFSNSTEALANLKEWGWSQNVYREFQIPAADDTDPNVTDYISVSVHKFDSSKDAAEALTYFADDVVNSQGLEDVQVDKLGDQSRALSGSPNDANLVVIYVRKGDYLIRIGGSSTQGDPTKDLVALAKKILN